MKGPYQMPVTLLLFVAGLTLLSHTAAPLSLWSPAFVGRAGAAPPEGDWSVTFDPRGWTGPLPGEASPPASRSILRFRSGGVTEVEAAEPAPSGSLHFAGSPRADFRFAREGMEVRGRLYQNRSAVPLLSGPLSVTLPSSLYAPPGDGVSLSTLNLFPPTVERAVWLDTRGIALPPKWRERWSEELSRWEFDPASLEEVFASPFCYLQWEGEALLSAQVRSREGVEQLLSRRFPSTVIHTTARWSQGSRITGFALEEKPAWFVRGDQIVATPTGGIDRLGRLLEERFAPNRPFLHREPLTEELRRLSGVGKGWHLCLIERQPRDGLHWAVLLRWSGQSVGTAEGFLIVYAAPGGSENETESASHE